MCGVIGVYSKQANVDLVQNIFLQTMIRGKHATGVTYLKNGGLHTIKDGIPANLFLRKYDFQEFVNEDGGLYMIGHIRYSTSDIRYNQPFSNGAISIAHNGVLSQEPVDCWEYKTETSNDSEMILRSFEEGHHPLDVFSHKSMAVCSITVDKIVSGFRNHERPLYYSRHEGGVYFTSTADIALRSGLSGTEKCDMFKVYNVRKGVVIETEMDSHGLYDLQ